MSKRRAVILSVTVQGLSQAEAARLYGLSEATVSRLLVRYRAEGDAAFEPRSRKPKTSPTQTPASTVALITNLRVELSAGGLDAGPETIAWHLARRHEITASISTIRRYLLRAGLIVPEPRKRPRASFIRFEAAPPHDPWPADLTPSRLADGTDTEILTWLDDHSRKALSVTAHRPVTGPVVVSTFLETAAEQGFPASVLTDNGLVYTARFTHHPGGLNQLETTLADLGITQKHSRPNHPTTCGKVERFQQTLKRWLAAQPPPATLDDLQAHLDAFVDEYNHRRPHRALQRRTPAVVYDLLPKTGPAGTGAGTHHRIRHDRIDKTGAISLRRAGRMHHISIGRAHAGTPVVLLINDLDIRVVNTTTGELLRHLTLDPTRGYQPRLKKQ
jgi:transposase InsO family protein